MPILSTSEFDFDVIGEASDIPRRRPPQPVPASPTKNTPPEAAKEPAPRDPGRRVRVAAVVPW